MKLRKLFYHLSIYHGLERDDASEVPWHKYAYFLMEYLYLKNIIKILGYTAKQFLKNIHPYYWKILTGNLYMVSQTYRRSDRRHKNNNLLIIENIFPNEPIKLTQN